MWSSGAIREWYQGRIGRRVMALLVEEVADVPEIGWVGAERPEVLVSAGWGLGGLELATPWPTARVVNGLLEAGDDCRYDRIVLLHELERAPDAALLIARCQRLLRPDGTLLLLVANRTSPWAVRDAFSPFGAGHAYSMGQVAHLLDDEGFSVTSRRYGLFVPPLDWPTLWRWPGVWRGVFRKRFPWLAGVLVIAARKDVLGMRALKVEADGSVRVAPVGVAAGA